MKTRLYLDDRRRLSPILLGIVGSFSLTIFMSYVGLHLENLNTVFWLILFIFALRNIPQLFLRVPLGNLSQMIGRKPLLIVGISFYTVSLFFLAISSHWALVIVAMFFMAIGMSCFWPIIFAYIGDVEEETNLGKVQGRLFQGTDLGAISGALLAFLLLKLSNLQISKTLTTNIETIIIIPEIVSTLSPLRILFAWGAGISLIGVIGMALFMPEVLKKEDRLTAESKMKALGISFVSMFKSLATVTKQKKLNFIYMIQLTVAFLEYTVTAFWPILVSEVKGLPYDSVAQIAWITSGVLIFFKPYLGKIVDKIGYKGPIFFTLLISSSMLILFIYVKSLPWLIVVYIIYSASSLTSYIGVNTGTTREAILTQRGMALGALGFYVSLSRSISTISFIPISVSSNEANGAIDWGYVLPKIFLITSIVIVSAVCLIYLVYYLIGNRNNLKEKKLNSVE
ncbi:MAG: MFS transporter [Candidatus Heimdallarchaeota archaeon]|nr:MFS transporter [Candidatus Heimdallarchaeota archaeon]